MPRERREDWEDAETRVLREDATAAAGPGPAGPPPPWWREHWWIWLALLGVLVIAALLVLWAAGRDEDDEATDTGTVALVVVPDVVGLDEQRAVEQLERDGLVAEVARAESGDAPEGEVVEQDPEPGSEVREQTTVQLTVSSGAQETVTVTTTETEAETEATTETETETETAEPEVAEVPDVVGLDHLDAAATVEELGFVPDTYPVPSAEPRGVVVAQNPDPGRELRTDERVRLNVSLGVGDRETATVPDVTGPAAVDARRACREAGFTCRTLFRAAPSPDNVGEVIDQQPPAGSSAPVLTQITLFVGR